MTRRPFTDPRRQRAAAELAAVATARKLLASRPAPRPHAPGFQFEPVARSPVEDDLCAEDLARQVGRWRAERARLAATLNRARVRFQLATDHLRAHELQAAWNDVAALETALAEASRYLRELAAARRGAG